MTKQSRNRRKARRAERTLDTKLLFEAIDKAIANYKSGNYTTGFVIRTKEELEAARCSAYEYLIP